METKIRMFELPKIETASKTPLKKGLRHAELSDLSKLCEWARDLYKDSPLETMSFSPRKIENKLLQALLYGFNDYFVIVAEHEGRPVGGLAAYAFEPIWSDEKMACEVLWHVEPEFRKGRRGLDMMEAYENWAADAGCSVVQYGWLASSPEHMPDLYRHRGCELAEHVYYKKVK